MSGPTQSTEIEVPRSMIPTGFQPVISSAVVDIYPLVGVRSFTTGLRGLETPIMSPEDSERYLKALRGERDFLRKLGRTLPDFPENGGVEKTHEFFVNNRLAKFGLRNLFQTGGNVTAEHCLVPHPAYACFGESQNQRLREFGANLGANLILVTSDGKLMLQHRKAENKVYGDVPGASIAGLVDVLKSGEIKTLNFLQVLKDHLFAEGDEEVGLAESVLQEFRLTSYQVDKVALHGELTGVITTSRSMAEIEAGALKNKRTNDPAAFRENIAFLDANPRVIQRLLTEVKSPFPPTHAGPLLMFGYQLMRVENSGTAEAWLHNVAQDMDANFRNIDKMADCGKYTPSKSATAQGLPSFPGELDRLFKDEYHYVACGK